MKDSSIEVQPGEIDHQEGGGEAQALLEGVQGGVEALCGKIDSLSGKGEAL